MTGIPGFWLEDGVIARLLAPFGRLTDWIARRRRSAFRYGRRRSWRAPMPVLIVGSIFVGGSGKTPLVIWLVKAARREGWCPGVVLRGYGGRARSGPQRVDASTDPVAVGDEAVLIARRTGVPVVAAADRCAAVRQLIADGLVDLVIADDGLQHYRLSRDAEIAVIDSARGLGNRRCLPAGPLREAPERLDAVDLVIGNGGPVDARGLYFTLRAQSPCPVGTVAHGSIPQPPEPVHAVAGIGHPARFFEMLEREGYTVTPHAFPDHHRYRAADLDFGDDLPVLMTEKDAVKCASFDRGGLWYRPVCAVPDRTAQTALLALLRGLEPGAAGRTRHG